MKQGNECPASTIFADALPQNQMLLNFGYTRSPGGSSHEIGELATVVGKTRRNISSNRIWVSILPASSALLIPAVIRTVAVT